MSNLHFDITADNANIIQKLRETEQHLAEMSKSAQESGDKIDEAVTSLRENSKATASVISELGKNFDVSNAEKQVIALNKVIATNRENIASLSSQISIWQKEADAAFANGQSGTFKVINRDIDDAVIRIKELTQETLLYSQALGTIEAEASFTPSSAGAVSAPLLFTSQSDYQNAEQLRRKIAELQDQITRFDGSEEDLQGLRDKLAVAKTDLSDIETQAAAAASALGDNLGSKAAETSTRLYELNAAVKNQTAIVEELTTSVDQALEAYNELWKGEDTKAIDNARDKYETLNSTLQNAKNKLYNLQAAQKDASASWTNTRAEVEQYDSVLVRLFGGQEKYNELLGNMPPMLQGFMKGLNGMTGAAKAFIATPLGAILGALVLGFKAVSTWLNSSVDGQMKLAHASGYVSGVLGQLKEVIIKAGKALYEAFENPQEAVKNLWESIKNNLVNRVKAIPEMLENLGRVVKAFFDMDWSEMGAAAKDTGNSFLKMTTGVDNLIGKTQEWVESVHDAASATAELNTREKELEIEISKWQIQKEKLNRIKAEASEKMYNTNLSQEERQKALKIFEDVIDKQEKTELAFIDQQIAIQRERMKITTKSIEDENKLRELLAERERTAAQFASQRATAQERSNQIERPDTSVIDRQEEINDALLALEKELAEQEYEIKKASTDDAIELIEMERDRQIAAYESERDALINKMREVGVYTEEEIKRVEELYDGIISSTKKIAGINITKVTEGKNKEKENKNLAEQEALWTDLNKVINTASKTFSELGEKVPGVLGEMISSLGQGASSGLEMANAIRGVSTAASGLEKASGILTAISAGLKIVTGIFGLFSANRKAEEENLKRLKEIDQSRIDGQREYNRLLNEQNLLYERGESILGNDPYGKAVNALTVYKKSLAEAKELLAGTEEQRDKYSGREYTREEIYDFAFNKKPIRPLSTSELQKQYSGLADIQMVVGSETYRNWFLGKKHTRDIYGSILDVYDDLITDEGLLNKERAQAILNTQKLDDASKKALEGMISKTEEYEEALAQMNEYLTGIFGSLGSELSDALVDAFRNGTDAAEAFEDSMSSMLERLAKEIAYSIAIAPLMEGIQEEIDKLNKDSSLSEIERGKKIQDLIVTFGEQVLGAGGEYDKVLEMFQTWAKEQGVDIFNPEEASRSASVQGIAQASQDSVEELNGRMTAVQGHTFSIAEYTKMLASNSSMMLDRLIGIETNTARLEAIENYMSGMRTDINSLVLKGIDLKR